MNQKKLSVHSLVRCAVIAAVYVVVCLVLAPFSYGAIQVRVAEALCLLPVFGAEYIVGVTLGSAALAAFNAVTVGIGELISCTILGVALVKLIESNAALHKFFTEE